MDFCTGGAEERIGGSGQSQAAHRRLCRDGRWGNLRQPRWRSDVGAGALTISAAVLFLGLAAGSPARAQGDPFPAMSAFRVMPPAEAPDVEFRGLDDRPMRLTTFRGRS